MKSVANVAKLGLDKGPRSAGGRWKEVLEETLLSSGKATSSHTENRGKFNFPHRFHAIYLLKKQFKIFTVSAPCLD